MSTHARQINGRPPRVATPAGEVERPVGSALMAAILAVQAQAPKLVRDARGQIQNRTYGYSTIATIVDAVLPLLVEHELTWTIWPTTEDGQPAIRYEMFHVPSGECKEDVMLLMCAMPNPQGQGSALTYARRQALVAVLNLTPDDDDDGAAASTPAPVDRYAEAEAAHNAAARQPSAAPAKASERPANAKQRGMLEAKARDANLAVGDFANLILSAAGDPPRVWRTDEHADQTLKRLLDRLPAKLVTAVKEGIERGAQR